MRRERVGEPASRLSFDLRLEQLRPTKNSEVYERDDSDSLQDLGEPLTSVRGRAKCRCCSNRGRDALAVLLGQQRPFVVAHNGSSVGVTQKTGMSFRRSMACWRGVVVKFQCRIPQPDSTVDLRDDNNLNMYHKVLHHALRAVLDLMTLVVYHLHFFGSKRAAVYTNSTLCVSPDLYITLRIYDYDL